MKIIVKIAVMGALLALTGCAANSQKVGFQHTYHDPDYTPARFNKVLAVVMTPDAGLRRSGEDQLVTQIRAFGPQAEPSYTVLTEDEAKDPATAKAKVAQAGFDGAVLMRLINREKEEGWVSGSSPDHYRSPWDYYGYGYPMMYDTGYLSENTKLSIETNVYSLTSNKLVWSGTSKIDDPGNVKEVVADLSVKVVENMQTKGLIPKR